MSYSSTFNSIHERQMNWTKCSWVGQQHNKDVMYR